MFGLAARMALDTPLVATVKSKRPDEAATRPPAPLLELSVTPLKDGTSSW